MSVNGTAITAAVEARLTLADFLRDNPQPTDAEIREGLSGNFCRCTGYQGIVAAAHRAAEVMRATDSPASTGASPR